MGSSAINKITNIFLIVYVGASVAFLAWILSMTLTLYNYGYDAPVWLPVTVVGTLLIAGFALLFVFKSMLAKREMFDNAGKTSDEKTRSSVIVRRRAAAIIALVFFIVLVVGWVLIFLMLLFPHQNGWGVPFLFNIITFVGIFIAVELALSIAYGYLKIIVLTFPREFRPKKARSKSFRVLQGLGLVALAVSMFVFSVCTCQSSFIFFPSSTYWAEQELAGLSDYSEISISKDGVDYAGIKYAPYDETAPTLLYFYGNSQTAAKLMHSIKGESAFDGYNIVCFDYPGYGKSSGTPGQSTIFPMALTVYDALATPEIAVNGDRVVVIGHSIGTGVAIYVAANRPVAGLALTAPYNNGVDLCNGYINIFYGPIEWFVTNKLPSNEFAREVGVKPFVAASESDGLVKYSQSVKLIENFPQGCDFLTLEKSAEVSHDDLPTNPKVLSGLGEYLQSQK